MANAAFAVTLGLIHSEVSILDQQIIIVRILWIPGQACGTAEADDVAVGHQHLLIEQLLVDLVDLSEHFLAIVDLVDEHVEFIAAHPSDQSAVTAAGLQDIGRPLDIFIAIIMAVGIIDIFEPIQIPHDKDSRTHIAFGKTAADLSHEGPAVQKMGQQIIVALVLDALFFHGLFGDVHDDAPNSGVVF